MIFRGLGLSALVAVLSMTGLVAGVGPEAERAGAQGDEATTTLTGTVTDEDGTPIHGLVVGTIVIRRIGPVSTLREAAEITFTASDGTFSLPMDAGPDVVRHALYVESVDYTECTVRGYRPGEVRGPASFAPEDGDIEDLRIELSGPPRAGSPRIDCNFATPPLRIEGTILGQDGQPQKGVIVRAAGSHASASRGPWAAEATGSSGAFAVEVPDGTYKLKAFVDYGDAECELGEYREGTVVPRGAGVGATPVDVTNSHVSGITMTLPQPLDELCRRVSGVVTNASGAPLGGPLAGQPVTLEAHGELAFYSRTTSRDEDGTFALYVAEGTYSLVLAARTGDRCHLDPAPLDIDSGGPDQFTVGDQGVPHLRVIISGVPPPPPPALPAAPRCSIPPASITTQLQPGWNLAGWTDVEVGVETLFADIPGLEVAHAWDAEAQAFQVAFRSNGSVSGDLVQVSPGMGLWLYLDGAQPVEWTQPVVPESSNTTLFEGWNLVAWSGEDATTPEAAFALLGSNLRMAVGWDPTTDELLRYEPEGASGDNTMRRLNRGEGVWVEASAGQNWLQPGSPGTPAE